MYHSSYHPACGYASLAWPIPFPVADAATVPIKGTVPGLSDNTENALAIKSLTTARHISNYKEHIASSSLPAGNESKRA